MKLRPQFSVLLLIGLMVLISLACISSSKAPDPTATSVPAQPVVEPTQPPPPTAAPLQPPTSVEEPVEEVIIEDESQPYYIEEFDSVPDNWSYFLNSGDEDDMDIYAEDGEMIFELRGEEQYAYYLYDDWTYEDVYLEASVDNRGKNDNMTTLICRYSDEGWYEFNIQNNGLYYIYAYTDYFGEWEYKTLYNGGSKNIKMGRDINIFAVECEEYELRLYINGILEREVEDTKYKLREGQVGVGVSSFFSLPIEVAVDYVLIDLP